MKKAGTKTAKMQSMARRRGIAVSELPRRTARAIDEDRVSPAAEVGQRQLFHQVPLALQAGEEGR